MNHLRRIMVPALDGLRAYRRSTLLLALVAGVSLGVALPVSWLADAAVPFQHTRLALPEIAGAGLAAPGSLVTRSVTATRQAASDTFFRFLLSGAGAVLLLGGLTALSLGAARAAMRRPEQATRRAIGASARLQLASLLIESLALVVGALGVGVPLGWMASRVASASWPGTIPGASSALPGYALLILLGIGCGSLVLPHLLAPRPHLGGESARPIALTIPIVQLALSLIVLLGAGMVMRYAARAAVSGVTGGAGTLIDLRASGAPVQRGAGYQRLLRQLQVSPAVSLVSLASAGTSRGLGTVESVLTDCGACQEGEIYTRFKPLLVTEYLASPDTFRALGTPLIAGRGFTLADDGAAHPVAVVSRSLALKGFQAGEAIGREIRIRTGGPDADPDGAWYRVIGIVEDLPAGGFGFGLQPSMAAYLSILQQPPERAELLVREEPGGSGAGKLLLPDGAIGAPIQQVALQRETEVAAAELAPLQWFGRGFGLLGWAMLGIAGLGAVVLMRSWLVSLLPELGLRWAVGATRGSLLRLVLFRVIGAAVVAAALAFWVAPGIQDTLMAVVGPEVGGPYGLLGGYFGLLGAAALAGLLWPLRAAGKRSPSELLESAGE